MVEFLRPEARAFLARWAETAGAAVIVALGVWVFTLGGWFFQSVGLLIAFAGLAGVLLAWRRMRFRREVAQPGVVEVVEGQVRYFGPEGGGFVAMHEVVEIALVRDLRGQDWWQLSEAGGNVVAIPASASGADALFDAFAALPGMDMGALSSAAAKGGKPASQALWRRETGPLLPHLTVH